MPILPITEQELPEFDFKEEHTDWKADREEMALYTNYGNTARCVAWGVAQKAYIEELAKW